MSDLQISGVAGFYKITPLSDAGDKWIEDNCDVPCWAWLGNGFGVDSSNTAFAIIAGAEADGLEVDCYAV